MTEQEAQQVIDIVGTPGRFFSRSPVDGIVFGASFSQAIELVTYANWADQANYNSYIQLNPSRKITGTRCRAEDITHWAWFVLDIDPVEEYNEPMKALDRAEDLMKAMFGLKELHRVVVDSGRGVQAWYPLGPLPTNEVIKVHTDPLPRDFELEDVPAVEKEMTIREAAPRVMSYWLGWLAQRMGTYEGCNIDTSCSDLSRVMRMPFTTNQKTGRRSTILTTTQKVNESLARRLLTYAPYHLFKERPVMTVIGNGCWTSYVGQMTRGGRIFLTEGSEEPGRHRAASAAMLSLMDLGCDLEQIKAALRFGGALCSPALPASETDQMVERRRVK